MLETSAKIIILIAVLVRVQQLPQMLSMKDYVLMFEKFLWKQKRSVR